MSDKPALFFTVEPSEAVRREDMIALPGDRLHFTVWGDRLDPALKYGVRWVRYSDGCYENETIEPIVGSIKPPRQANELQFCMNVLEDRTNTQFAILIGGKNLFGTFSETLSTKYGYMQAVAKWLRKSKIVREVKIQGSDICVTMDRVVDCCDLANSKIEIALGKPSKYNTNKPTISKLKIDQAVRPAQDFYELYVADNIVEGNVFQIDQDTYIAQSGDTARDVIKHFTESGKMVFPYGIEPYIYAAAGGLQTVNTNSPSIVASYENTVSGNDNYSIIVGSDVREGNVFVVNGVSKIASSTDTKGSIEAFFNFVSGYYQVTAGQTVNVSAVKGLGFVANGNTPVLALQNKKSYPERSFDVWQITIGAQVAKGNVFEVNGQKVVAEEGNTPYDIGQKLSNLLSTETAQTSVNPFLIETKVGSNVSVGASAGTPILDADKTNIVLSCSTLKPYQYEQMFVQVVVPCEEGCYSLEVYNEATREAVGRTNNIHVSKQYIGNSTMLLFWETKKAYQFEHQEGFVHRVRIKSILDNPKQLIEETERYSINGQLRRGLTQINLKYDFTTAAYQWWYHVALGPALKHTNLLFDNEETFCRGEYKLTDRSKGSDKYQAKIEALQPNKRLRNYNQDCERCDDGAPKVTILNNIFGVKASVQKCCKEIEDNEIPDGKYDIVLENVLYAGELLAKVGLCGEPIDVTLKEGIAVKISIENCNKERIEISIEEPQYCMSLVECCDPSDSLQKTIIDNDYTDGEEINLTVGQNIVC